MRLGGRDRAEGAPLRVDLHALPRERDAADAWAEPEVAVAGASGAVHDPAAGDAGRYDYAASSVVAGPLTDPPEDRPYRVRFKRLGKWRPVRTSLLVFTATLFIGGFFVWLMLPAHWHLRAHHGFLRVVSEVMIASTGVIGLFALINLWTLCRASLVARDPIPVRPQAGTRVAFLTTIVPSREPLAMVRRTLEAALAIRHEGRFDVWLLDEGDDEAVRAVCEELGVHHFSRRGVEEWNQPRGRFKARSKHGNYNSWLAAYGSQYDFFLSVDPDHVPMPNMAERLLGYFRDSDIAFVVGPQVYGNYRGFVTRSAESQQFLFHSLLQRAGNRVGTPMLVGTNNAVRIDALASAGYLRDSVTEDMATSLAIHTTRNALTGRRWRSVYTPDVVAVGEGPATFADYFSQQYRWSRGTDEVLLRQYPRSFLRLGARRAIHYGLLMSYYPTTAVAWILGVADGLAYLILGAGGLSVSPRLWLMLYLDAAAMQVALYFWNRRHNVSPHEDLGSSGLAGMFISALTVPIYVSSFVAAVLRRPSTFVVTPKGNAASRDTMFAFRRHLQWSAPIIAAFAVAALLGHTNPWMCVWSLISLLVCLLPVAIWHLSSGRRRPPRPTLVASRAPRALEGADLSARLASSSEAA